MLAAAVRRFFADGTGLNPSTSARHLKQIAPKPDGKEPAMATTPESFVDALNSAFGKQTTQRSAHAKGVVLLGKFVPAAEAASVSKALHFKHEVPVTVRFSANSGIAKIADAERS